MRDEVKYFQLMNPILLTIVRKSVIRNKKFWLLSLFAIIQRINSIGDSPSGKAADFDSAIRGFESLIPNHTKSSESHWILNPFLIRQALLLDFWQKTYKIPTSCHGNSSLPEMIVSGYDSRFISLRYEDTSIYTSRSLVWA